MVVWFLRLRFVVVLNKTTKGLNTRTIKQAPKMFFVGAFVALVPFTHVATSVPSNVVVSDGLNRDRFAQKGKTDCTSTKDTWTTQI